MYAQKQRNPNQRNRSVMPPRRAASTRLITVDNVLQNTSDIPSMQQRQPPPQQLQQQQRPRQQRQRSRLATATGALIGSGGAGGSSGGGSGGSGGSGLSSTGTIGRLASQSRLPPRTTKVSQKLVLLPETETDEDEEMMRVEGGGGGGKKRRRTRRRVSRVGVEGGVEGGGGGGVAEWRQPGVEGGGGETEGEVEEVEEEEEEEEDGEGGEGIEGEWEEPEEVVAVDEEQVQRLAKARDLDPDYIRRLLLSKGRRGKLRRGDFDVDNDVAPLLAEEELLRRRRLRPEKAKSYAERLPKARRAEKVARVTAYCTAQAYKMGSVASFVREWHGARVKLYDDCLYSAYQLPLLHGHEGYRLRSGPTAKYPGGKSMLDEEIERNELRDHHEDYMAEALEHTVGGGRTDHQTASTSATAAESGTEGTEDYEGRHHHHEEHPHHHPHSTTTAAAAGEEEDEETHIADDQPLKRSRHYPTPQDAPASVTSNNNNSNNNNSSSNNNNTASSPTTTTVIPPGIPHKFLHVAEMFVFSYGVVVFWNFTERQEKDLLADLAFATSSVTGNPILLATLPLHEEDFETEEFHFEYSTEISRPRVYNDMITLRSGDHMIKLAISHGIAQSTKLCFFEEVMARQMAEAKDVPRRLATTGKLGMKREEVFRILGRLFKSRVEVNLSSNVLDVPNFFWESEPTLYPLYNAVREYLEIKPRIQVLNERCRVFLDLAEILSDSIADNKTSNQTWVCIILIVISIFVTISEVVLRFGLLSTREGGSSSLSAPMVISHGLQRSLSTTTGRCVCPGDGGNGSGVYY